MLDLDLDSDLCISSLHLKLVLRYDRISRSLFVDLIRREITAGDLKRTKSDLKRARYLKRMTNYRGTVELRVFNRYSRSLFYLKCDFPVRRSISNMAGHRSEVRLSTPR